MAKMFMNAEEASQRLRVSEEQLKALVREGKLREFRDAGKVNYKTTDVEKVASEKSGAPAPPAKSSAGSVAGGSAVGRSSSAAGRSAAGKSAAGRSAAGASASGEILLEPVEDSSIELAPAGSDILTLERADAADTATGAELTKRKKEGSSVPSVGVNVFDDDELDEHVDPLAQTAVSDVAGLGIEGAGSGSGILDLTRESDDTSLGAELLEEIYTGDEPGEKKEAGSGVAMGEDTRAGLDAGIPEAAEPEPALAGPSLAVARTRTVVTEVIDYGPDPVSSALTALLVVAVAVMGVAGLAAAAMVQGVVPGLLGTVYSNLMIFAGGALALAAIAAGATFLIAKKKAQ
jgi:hypothetical protein